MSTLKYIKTYSVKPFMLKKRPFIKNQWLVINVHEYPKTHFVSRMTLPGIDKVFVGYGRSKNDARKDVCRLAYDMLCYVIGMEEDV